MQIKRLDIGFWRKKNGKLCWSFFEFDKGLCGCSLLTIGCVCITWLGDECLQADQE